MIVHSKGCILLSGDAALFLWPYLPKDCHCLNTEILHTVLTIKRLKWEQEMYLIASLALILNFEF